MDSAGSKELIAVVSCSESSIKYSSFFISKLEPLKFHIFTGKSTDALKSFDLLIYAVTKIMHCAYRIIMAFE